MHVCGSGIELSGSAGRDVEWVEHKYKQQAVVFAKDRGFARVKRFDLGFYHVTLK